LFRKKKQKHNKYGLNNEIENYTKTLTKEPSKKLKEEIPN
jgi:hypothetical protein